MSSSKYDGCLGEMADGGWSACDACVFSVLGGQVGRRWFESLCCKVLMHSESFPAFELVADAAPPVNCVQQSGALVSPLYPCACKEEKTLSCTVGLEEKSKTFQMHFLLSTSQEF